MPKVATKPLRRYTRRAGDTHNPESLLQCRSFLLHDIILSAETLKILQEENQLHREAERIRNIAQGKADAFLMKAQADARSLALIAEVLKNNSDLLVYQYIEKLSPNLRAIIVPSNAPLLLPFSDLEKTGETKIQE